ncbi:MAG: helix-turn-helix transcriptional regulator [Proteobacteria bacterium]|nr:helix-turn-helix transcriptional regulator [Pseudomonadota bacterium]
MITYATQAEQAAALGERLRALRLERNLHQDALAARAGVALNAVKNLESGRGTIRTLVAVLRALGRDTWLDALAPLPTINPLALPKAGRPRQRARASRGTAG